MKKVLFLVAALFLAFTLSACNQAETFEIAMITDVGTIDDESFNQGTWEGIVQFAEEFGYTHKYYQPSEQSDAAYLDAISLAVEGGAKVVVTPGYLFEPSIYEAQTLYPDVKFILIDGVPHTADYSTYETKSNTMPILFNEHESGFLAGYGAVMDGYTELGFMGGMAVPAVVKFGIGYIAGAFYAAEELGVTINFTDDTYEYLNSFAADATIVDKASAWYNDGTEVIFAAAGGAGASVWTAAENQSAMMIGVDVNQGSKSDTVLTSAMKQLGNAVYQALTAYKDGTFTGGTTIRKGVDNEGVALPTDTESWRFETFTVAQYDAIYAELVAGTVEVPADYATLVTFLTGLGFTTGYPTESVVSPS